MLQQLKNINTNLYADRQRLTIENEACTKNDDKCALLEKDVNEMKTICINNKGKFATLEKKLNESEKQCKQNKSDVGRSKALNTHCNIIEERYVTNLLNTMAPRKAKYDIHHLYLKMSASKLRVVQRTVYKLEAIRMYDKVIYMFETTITYLGSNLYKKEDMTGVINKVLHFFMNYSTPSEDINEPPQHFRNMWVDVSSMLKLLNETGEALTQSMELIRDMTERFYRVAIKSNDPLMEYDTEPPMEPKGLYMRESVTNRARAGIIRLFYRA